jgi:hypothetical protein
MDSSSIAAILIVGGAGLLIIAFTFWAGQALLSFLEHRGPTVELDRGRSHQPPNERLAGGHIPDSRERLASRLESNDVDVRLESPR